MEETTPKEEIVELEFTEETLKIYIPTVMVELPGEMGDEAAEVYGLKSKE